MSNLAIKNKCQGVEIVVRGTVQGVGFRPFIYNIASRLGITGDVCNSGAGVVINAFSTKERLALFAETIVNEAPPLARIHSIDSTNVAAKSPLTDLSFNRFRILASSSSTPATTSIPPDIAICEDCYRDITNPRNRRAGYPFTNCTNCGPRFTIVETIPYDRPKTSMKTFTMCTDCKNEYNNPSNRRFHAQPNACPICGPRLWVCDSRGQRIEVPSPLTVTIQSLHSDEVVAIRGLGGFHLSVNAYSAAAVTKLRTRKGRPDKPLAIMVADLGQAKSFCSISDEEITLLQSPAHPIVLLKKRVDSKLAENLAPGIKEIGVMLAYTPLHHLLFSEKNCPEALVMTSGNISGTPICTSNEDALSKLGSIADTFLLHNREIVTRVDDSVVKRVSDSPIMLRRARGFVPSPVRVKWQLPQVLSCGAGLKNTFSLGRGTNIFPSQHIGDLDNLESSDFLSESVAHLQSVYQLEPEIAVCDLHPDYPSSRYAFDTGLPLYQVQHHHAHGVAVMAEHGLTGPVLAIILDGSGLGDDSTIWGGEILKISPTDYERLGHLSHLHLPGGDIAATQPWRMGLSILHALYSGSKDNAPGKASLPPALQNFDEEKIRIVESMLTGNFNSPLTSSCGRLFDGIASLLGVRQEISYEGQAAMELEALAQKAATGNWLDDLTPETDSYDPVALHPVNGKWEISSPEFAKMILEGIAGGEQRETLALRFHVQLIRTVTQLISYLSDQTGIRQVVLSGGCMQNSLLLEGFLHALQKIKLQAFTGNTLPMNDGAISIGQSVIGGLRHVSRDPDESNRR